MTTGLLLGIGETEEDWWETLVAISESHKLYHHIQEVILQPHSPGTVQTLDAPPFNPHKLPEVIAKAREILPADITIERCFGWLEQHWNGNIFITTNIKYPYLAT